MANATPSNLRPAEAQYSLGVMYINGNGVEQDIGAALKWVKLASANGDDMAKQAIAQIENVKMTQMAKN